MGIMSEPTVKKAKFAGGTVISVAALTLIFGYVNREVDDAKADAIKYTDHRYEVIIEKLKSIDEKIQKLVNQ